MGDGVTHSWRREPEVDGREGDTLKSLLVTYHRYRGWHLGRKTEELVKVMFYRTRRPSYGSGVFKSLVRDSSVVEQVAVNHRVVGSIPSPAAKV